MIGRKCAKKIAEFCEIFSGSKTTCIHNVFWYPFFDLFFSEIPSNQRHSKKHIKKVKNIAISAFSDFDSLKGFDCFFFRTFIFASFFNIKMCQKSGNFFLKKKCLIEDLTFFDVKNSDVKNSKITKKFQNYVTKMTTFLHHFLHIFHDFSKNPMRFFFGGFCTFFCHFWKNGNGVLKSRKKNVFKRIWLFFDFLTLFF